MVFTFTVVAPITAEAGCSYNGYINSGGKCAKSWEKKKNGKSSLACDSIKMEW